MDDCKEGLTLNALARTKALRSDLPADFGPTEDTVIFNNRRGAPPKFKVPPSAFI